MTRKQTKDLKWALEQRLSVSQADEEFYKHETILPPRILTEEQKKEILMWQEHEKHHRRFCELRDLRHDDTPEARQWREDHWVCTEGGDGYYD